MPSPPPAATHARNTGGRRRGAQHSWPILLVLLITAAVYAPACLYEFISRDDAIHVYENPHMNPPRWSAIGWYWTHGYQELYIPVAYSAWTVIAMLARTGTPDVRGVTLNPYVFHSVNVLLHLLTTLAVYDVLRVLLKHRAAAAIGAALFALHPLQVEAVAWISGFRDLIAGFFCVVALGQYLRAVQSCEQASGTAARARVWRYLAIAVAAYVLALLSKPAAVTLPLVAGALDLLIVRRPPRRVAIAILPGLILAIPIVIVAMRVQPVNPAVPRPPLAARPIVALDACGFYLWKLVAPVRLAIDYGRRPDLVLHGGLQTAMDVIFTAAIGIGAIVLRRRAPWFVAGAAVMGLALLPVLGLVSFGYQLFSTVADRYMYVAMLGPSVVAGAVFSVTGARESKLAWSAATAVMLALAILTAFQIRAWSDAIRNYEHGLSVNPNSFVAQNNLAAALLEAGEPESALPHAQAAVHLRGDAPIAWFNLGDILNKLQRYPQAIDAYQTGLKLLPTDAAARANLAMALANVGRAQDARREFDHAVRTDPSFESDRPQLEQAIRSHPPATTATTTTTTTPTMRTR